MFPSRQRRSVVLALALPWAGTNPARSTPVAGLDRTQRIGAPVLRPVRLSSRQPSRWRSPPRRAACQPRPRAQRRPPVSVPSSRVRAYPFRPKHRAPPRRRPRPLHVRRKLPISPRLRPRSVASPSKRFSVPASPQPLPSSRRLHPPSNQSQNRPRARPPRHRRPYLPRQRQPRHSLKLAASALRSRRAATPPS
jgi:hypothetical protein